MSFIQTEIKNELTSLYNSTDTLYLFYLYLLKHSDYNQTFASLNIMPLLIFFFLISIIFSFLCSIWEAVLLSITPSFAEIKFKEGGQVGDLLKSYKENIDRPLSAILTLNTIAHTVGAMGVGYQAEKVFGSEGGIHLDLVFYQLEIGNSAIIGTVMTLAILILSEIIPKTLGANYWKQLTNFTVLALNIIITLLYPLVWLSQLITKSLKKDKDKSVLSRADFSAMADIGEKEGLFREGESKIIKNLLRFNTIRTKDVMTPRTVVKAASQETPIQEFYEKNKTLRFSRIPVFQNAKDEITGFILKDELLQSIIDKKGDQALKTIKRDILIVNEQFPIPDLFTKLIESREHIALVVDEFGGMAGIATMEDVIETLLGLEIVDEMDNTENMQMLARKRWEARAKDLGLFQIIEEAEEEQKDHKKS